MKKTKITFGLLIITIMSICNCSLNSPTTNPAIEGINAKIIVNDQYNYGDSIEIKLEIEKNKEEMSIEWSLDSKEMPIKIENPYEFKFILEPEVTKKYTLKVKINNGITTSEIEKEITVLQMPIVGTWEAKEQNTPVGVYDIIGIWRIDNFEMYYLDKNGKISDSSAKGKMDLPKENEWLDLNQEYSWVNGEWIQYDYYMKGKYTFHDEKKDKNQLVINFGYEPNSSWIFNKIDDSTDSWF